MKQKLVEALSSCPLVPQKLAYGTAGFRADASLLDAVFVKVGALAALRSIQTGLIAAVVVTASHNPVADNGVKIIDPDGGMLARSWEQYACELADAPTSAVPGVIASIALREGIDLGSPVPPCVFLGRDTRPSSAGLLDRVGSGARALAAVVTDYGLLTTPQMHHIVRMANFPSLSSGGAYSGVEGYYTMLRVGFEGVTRGVLPPTLSARGTLHVDCAHGVGGQAARTLAASLAGLVDLRLYNTGEGEGDVLLLNEGVGAEHAQKERLPPSGFTVEAHAGARCASLDGDADRLVYHTFSPADGAWHLLDGDKIAVLAASWLASTLKSAGFTLTGTPSHPHVEGHHAWSVPDASVTPPLATLRDTPVSVGIVQTAYANGASTAYVTHVLRLPSRLAKTGVKYVHHAAAEFDVGVYFEANGHGTVLFHPRFMERLASVAPSAVEDAVLVEQVGAPAAAALRKLHAASLLINQAIGDALSDALFVEAALACEGWSVSTWDALYADLPSRQAKVRVADRAAIQTTEDESRVLHPAALQGAIDALVASVPCGRAFVRPSGTEDVVRVYAEGASVEDADALALAIARAAYDHAGGTGKRPE